MNLFHRSGWSLLATVTEGQTFTLVPGAQSAEGVGVYFSEGAPVRQSTAEGTRSGQTAIVVMPLPGSRKGWWVSKGAKAKFGKPRTWHSDGKPLDLAVTGIVIDEHGQRVVHVRPVSQWAI